MRKPQASPHMGITARFSLFCHAATAVEVWCRQATGRPQAAVSSRLEAHLRQYIHVSVVHTGAPGPASAAKSKAAAPQAGGMASSLCSHVGMNCGLIHLNQQTGDKFEELARHDCAVMNLECLIRSASALAMLHCLRPIADRDGHTCFSNNTQTPL